MDLKKYLERINYKESPDLTYETLKNLQLLHLRSVPFENLSIHLREPIILQYESLFAKIVLNKRGGFCYELNGLFTALLRQLGFNVSMLSAGVAKTDGGFGPDFDHMTLMVLLEDRWLVDVGFGDSFQQPLLIDNREVQVQENRSYQIENADNYFILKEKKKNGEWITQYRFSLHPYVLSDYSGMCFYHQTSPESDFTKKRICTIAKPNGRLTLSNMHFIETRDNERRERFLKDELEYIQVLEKEFGIPIKNIK